VLVAVCALVLVVVHLGPVRRLLIDRVIDRLAEEHDVDVRVARLDYNLLTLRGELHGLELRRTAVDLPPFLRVDRIEVDLPWSIVSGRIAADTIEIDHPRISIIRREGVLNLPADGLR